MKPDSTVVRYLAEHAGEHGALPLPVLIVLLVGMFGLGALTVWKLGNLKTYLGEPPFPTHAASVVAGIAAFMGMSVVAMSRIALGMEMPEGWGDFIILVGAVIGVAGAWGVGKRATSDIYLDGKARIEAAKSGQAVPEGMTETAERRSPLGRKTDVKPVVPANDPRLPSPLDDERD